MPEFFVLNSTGALKVGGGTGSGLPDPLTILHGGTNLTNILNGEMLYASANDVFSTLGVDNDLGEVRFKYMCNLGFPGEPVAPSGYGLRPRWGNLNQDTYGLGFNLPASLNTNCSRPQGAYAIIGSTSYVGQLDSAGGFASTANPTSIQTVASSVYGRYNVTSSSNNGLRFSSAMGWAEHKLIFTVKFKIPVLTDLHFMSGWTTSPGLFTPADTLTTVRLVGVRFSSTAGDIGFTPIYSDGNGQTNYTTLGTVVADAIYILNIIVNNAISDISIVDVATGKIFSQRVPINAGLMSQDIRPAIMINIPSGAGSQDVDISSYWVNIGG